MFHQIDLALQRFRSDRDANRAPGRGGAGHPRYVAPIRRPALGLQPWRGDRSMPPAALRVLETTWRLWREPAA